MNILKKRKEIKVDLKTYLTTNRNKVHAALYAACQETRFCNNAIDTWMVNEKFKTELENHLEPHTKLVNSRFNTRRYGMVYHGVQQRLIKVKCIKDPFDAAGQPRWFSIKNHFGENSDYDVENPGYDWLLFISREYVLDMTTAKIFLVRPHQLVFDFRHVDKVRAKFDTDVVRPIINTLFN
jgi:hypothetical protein